MLHDETERDIHFGLYVPDSYDGSKPYALFVTRPGYGGYYSQGVGVNIRTEDFGVEAQKPMQSCGKCIRTRAYQTEKPEEARVSGRNQRTGN